MYGIYSSYPYVRAVLVLEQLVDDYLGTQAARTANPTPCCLYY